MPDEIVNRVAASELVTLDLEMYYPKEEIVVFDIKSYLFKELVLKEKEFRLAMQELDTKPYEGKLVALTCSNDAIVPAWAFMLVTTYLQPVAKSILMGNEEEVRQELLLQNLSTADLASLAGRRVVVKGCGDKEVDVAAYVEITRLLLPHVKTLMYGEPCSTVPLFKRK